LNVTVTRWPNIFGWYLQYTTSHQIASGGVAFTRQGWTITAITFTDIRGCTATVNR
jgi:hypothetical protein